MDIRIGGSAPIGPTPGKTPEAQEQIEARVLAVRAPRRRKERAPKKGAERRAKPHQRDPRSGRVLLLMISNGLDLPRDLETGAYRVFLRIVRR